MKNQEWKISEITVKHGKTFKFYHNFPYKQNIILDTTIRTWLKTTDDFTATSFVKYAASMLNDQRGLMVLTEEEFEELTVEPTFKQWLKGFFFGSTGLILIIAISMTLFVSLIGIAGIIILLFFPHSDDQGGLVLSITGFFLMLIIFFTFRMRVLDKRDGFSRWNDNQKRRGS